MKDLPKGPYSIIYADPPWPYYGDPNKDGAAGKHYDLMTQEELHAMDVRSIASARSWLFLWATPPKLHLATELMSHWGFHYRNVAYFWRKTTKDGKPISDRQGVRPTYTKTAWFELLLLGTSKQRGRMTPLSSEAHPSDIAAPIEIAAPREAHSKKPALFRDLIVEQLGGHLPRIELFARSRSQGWDAWGLETPARP